MTRPISGEVSGQLRDGDIAAGDERRRRAVFAVVSIGFVMASLDLMIVNVSLPAIREEFAGSSIAALSWTVSGYAIVFAALLVVAGGFADRQGRKGWFLVGIALFTAASVLCASAFGVGALIAARVLQAAGAAIIVPTSLGLLLAAYPPERRNAAIGAWTALGSAAAALGPIVGGALVEVSWRWIFLINIPFGLLALLIGRKVLPRPPAGGTGPLPDVFGSVLFALGVGAIALGLVQAPEWGWTSGGVAACVVVSLLAFAVFFVRSARHPKPLVPVALLRIPSFNIANATALLFNVCFAAMLLSYMLWTQQVWGYSAMRTGLALAPGTFLMPLVAVVANKIIARVGAAVVAATGCLLLAGGVAWWAVFAEREPDYWTALLPGVLLTPVGMILALTTLTTIASRDLPAESYSTGGAVNMMVRQVGSVLGVSMFVAVLGVSGEVAQFRTGWWLAVGAGVAAALLSLLLVRRRSV